MVLLISFETPLLSMPAQRWQQREQGTERKREEKKKYRRD
jgi:hypothetical protein